MYTKRIAAYKDYRTGKRENESQASAKKWVVLKACPPLTH